MAEYTFFTNELCPFCHRAAIAINAVLGSKVGDLVAHKAISLTAMPDWYIQTINPKGQVPTLGLTGSGEFMYESAIIAEFILEKHDLEGKVLPKDPLVKARHRQFISSFGDNAIPMFYEVLRSRGDDIKKAKESALETLKQLNESLKKTSPEGPFAFGKQLGLADLQTLPWLLRWSAIEHYRDFKIPAELTRLHQWIKAGAAHEAIKKTQPTDAVVIEGYKGYALDV